MQKIFKQTLLLAALISSASLAQANTVHATISDVSGSLSFDGWNELNRNRVGGALTAAQLLAGTVANVAGSGDAVLSKLSGSLYPAGAGLYGDGALSFTDNSLVAGLSTLVFQGIINDFDAQFGNTPFSLTLSYNGGSQALAASSVSSVLNGGVSDLHTYTWDLSGLGAPISSYTLNLNAGFSQMLAFQIDQTVAAPVPEPSSYALLACGLAVIGGVARRRQQAGSR